MEDKQPKKHDFVCHGCKSGFVCEPCGQSYDCGGVIFEIDERDQKKILTCPCCRQLNWRYYYDMFVSVTLGNDLYDTGAYDDIPVVKNIFLKNHCEAWDIDYEERIS
jgi:hypothetical protein